jgi:drug/metabolite transporter (DMT)-like permease
MAMTRKDWIQFSALAALWGASYLFIKVALEDDLSPAMIVFVRTAVAALVLLPFAGRGGALAGLRERIWPVAVLALLQIAAPFLLISAGEQHLSSSLTGILVATAPIFTFLLAIGLDQEERVHGTGLFGVLLGIAGVVLLLGVDAGGGTAALVGGLMVILASLGYALGAFYIKRRLGDVQALGLVTATMAASALMTLPLAAISFPSRMPAADALGALLALGALGTGLAFVLFYGLIARVGPGKASLVAYVAPGFAVIYGVVLLDEGFGVASSAGLVMIVAGSWLAAEGRIPRGRRYAISQDRAERRSHDMSHSDDFTLRLCAPGDAFALERLAQLDSTHYGGRRMLVADVGHEIVAALPLDGGAAIADPFRRSAELVDLLHLRLEQLAAAGEAELRAEGLSRGPRAGRRLRRYRAHASA